MGKKGEADILVTFYIVVPDRGTVEASEWEKPNELEETRRKERGGSLIKR